MGYHVIQGTEIVPSYLRSSCWNVVRFSLVLLSTGWYCLLYRSTWKTSLKILSGRKQRRTSWKNRVCLTNWRKRSLRKVLQRRKKMEKGRRRKQLLRKRAKTWKSLTQRVLRTYVSTTNVFEVLTQVRSLSLLRRGLFRAAFTVKVSRS